MDSAQLKNKNEGGGNSAEDEGISSSEQDDCEEESTSKKVKTPYKMYNNSLSQGDTAVEEVLEDFDKVLNDASTTESGSGGGDRHVSSASSGRGGGGSDNSSVKRFYGYADDVAIVPTRIVPEPPRRSRSLFVNKNFEVNPFFEEEDDDDDDEESANSECAYEEDGEEDEDEDNSGGPKTSKKRTGETFRSVQKQIKRFSALAVQRGAGGRTEVDLGVGKPRKDDGRRKSIYDVFGNVAGRPVTAVAPQVTRSASTRNVNVNDSRIPVMRFEHCKSERSVYLPTGYNSCGKDTADKEPAKVFVTRGHNNAGLYSGYTAGAGNPQQQGPIKCKPIATNSNNGLKALQHVNVMSVSTGKLTDFPSGLY